MTRPRTTLRKRAVLGGLLAALGAALLLPAAQALAPNELLLLVNARSPASRALANCYINPLFPTSGPATGSFIGLHAKSKFLAIELLFPRLRSGHRLFQRPSRKKQIPSNKSLCPRDPQRPYIYEAPT